MMMNREETAGFLALKHANGIPFREMLDLHAKILAGEIRAATVSEQFTGIDAADLIDPEVS